MRRSVRVQSKDGKAYRKITYSKPSPSFVRDMEKIAARTLETCEMLFREYDSLDTAVRDISHDAIARLLHIAYDCRSCALGLNDAEFSSFIDNSVAEWLRQRGFAEWYCQGAGTLFNRSRPRILSIDFIGNPKRGARLKRKAKR